MYINLIHHNMSGVDLSTTFWFWKKWKQLESSSIAPLFQYNHSNSFLLSVLIWISSKSREMSSHSPNHYFCGGGPDSAPAFSFCFIVLKMVKKVHFDRKCNHQFIDKLWKLDGPGMGQYWIKPSPHNTTVHQNVW